MVTGGTTGRALKTAFLFPGQGAQYAGMGHDFYERFPQARAVFDRASFILGPAFVEAIFYGPEDRLRETELTQPAILTASTAIYRVLEDLGIKAAAFAGLSLGEYSALVAAGAISFDDALVLVRKRGIYMQEAVPVGKGKMAAVMGLPHQVVENICREANPAGFVAPANYNCPGQVVISGHIKAVDYTLRLAREAGAKRITELKVSAPFHCALLKPIEERMARELEQIEIRTAALPVVSNVSAAYEEHPAQIKRNLIVQVSNPILWEQSVRLLISKGIKRFIGLGPGSSLSRLMKRIDPRLATFSVERVEDIDMLPENR